MTQTNKAEEITNFLVGKMKEDNFYPSSTEYTFIHKWLREYASLKLSEHLADGSDAISFAEWIAKTRFERFTDNKIIWWGKKYNGEQMTTAELYAIFKALPAPDVDK